jgi:hypothetical protein
MSTALHTYQPAYPNAPFPVVRIKSGRIYRTAVLHPNGSVVKTFGDVELHDAMTFAGYLNDAFRVGKSSAAHVVTELRLLNLNEAGEQRKHTPAYRALEEFGFPAA